MEDQERHAGQGQNWMKACPAPLPRVAPKNGSKTAQLPNYLMALVFRAGGFDPPPTTRGTSSTYNGCPLRTQGFCELARANPLCYISCRAHPFRLGQSAKEWPLPSKQLRPAKR